jgi:hypothetical protein
MATLDTENLWVVQIQVQKGDQKMVLYYYGDGEWTEDQEDALLMTETESNYMTDSIASGDLETPIDMKGVEFEISFEGS